MGVNVVIGNQGPINYLHTCPCMFDVIHQVPGVLCILKKLVAIISMLEPTQMMEKVEQLRLIGKVSKRYSSTGGSFPSARSSNGHPNTIVWPMMPVDGF